MSVSGYSDGWLRPGCIRYVVSLIKTDNLHCFSRLSCDMSTRWGCPCEGCSVL